MNSAFRCNPMCLLITMKCCSTTEFPPYHRLCFILGTYVPGGWSSTFQYNSMCCDWVEIPLVHLSKYYIAFTELWFLFLMIEDRNSVKSIIGSFYVSIFKMTSLQKNSQNNTECDLNCSKVAWKNLKLNLSAPDKIYYPHIIVDILQ